MKITTQLLLTIITLMLGFSQHALSNNNSQKIARQEIIGDSTKLISKNLPTSIYQIKSTVKKQSSIFDQMYLSTDDILEFSLTTDLQNLIINKRTNDYQTAFIEIKGSNAYSIKHELKVKPRGKFRRKICDFPPLKLNFSKEALINHGLNPEFDKLKLVTHCTDNKFDAKENILREFLTYQLYNKLTDNSFRTKLVKIEYIDLHNSSKKITRYGFLIEDKDEMAMRLNGEICDCHGLKKEMISKTQLNLTAMYQYMIGNEDWDSAMLRNVKAVQLFTGGNIGNNIIVPYDFDFSGVVDATYGIPSPDLRHTTMQQRHFFGEFSDENEFKMMSNHFSNKKKEILQTVKGFKHLSLSARIEIAIYLKEFFSILEDEQQAAQVFFKQENIVSQDAE